MATKIGFACCFCGREVETAESEGNFGLALVNPIDGEFLEQWWCHGICLSELLQVTAREASPFLPQIGEG